MEEIVFLFIWYCFDSTDSKPSSLLTVNNESYFILLLMLVAVVATVQACGEKDKKLNFLMLLYLCSINSVTQIFNFNIIIFIV